MKEEKKRILIKDVATATISWLVGGIVFCLMLENFSFAGIVCGFMVAGLPFGWRWLSNVITATSLLTVVIKGILSIILGWIAIIVVILVDIIAYVRA